MILEFTQKPIPYNPSWPNQFCEEAQILQNIFGNHLLGLHHVGSTAVPGLMAKPIIDMIGEMSDVKLAEEFSAQMERLGYIFKGEFGIPDRAFFTRTTEVAVHLHLFPKNHFQIKKHLVFRDYLIKYPEAVTAYTEKKKELLTLFPNDRNQYQNGKNELILELTNRALNWSQKSQ